jgi:3-oxoadipate enol-lactonase
MAARLSCGGRLDRSGRKQAGRDGYDRLVDAVELAYDEAGTGPVVVLIHGHPFNRSMWAPQLAALAGGYRVIAPDLRGYGGSPVTPGTVPMSQLAADVTGLLDRLGVSRAAPVGLSMGGLVAMELAVADPARWWALGLVATTARPVTEAEQADRRAAADRAERDGIRSMAQDMAARLFGPDVDQAVASQVMAMMLATDPRGAAAALRGRAERPDYRPLLAELDLPAFVCTGDHDLYSTAAITDELTGCLRRPHRVTLAGVGHLPNLELPDRFNAELLAFLGPVTAR